MIKKSLDAAFVWYEEICRTWRVLWTEAQTCPLISTTLYVLLSLMIAKVQLHMHAVFLCYIFHYNLFNLFLHSSLDRSKYQSGGIICGCIQLALYNLTVYHRELYVTTITIMKCHNHLKVLIKYQRVTNLISFSCFFSLFSACYYST